jgi:NhaC family Na+:H+ antiporter
MELFLGFLLSFIILIFGVFKGIYIGYCIGVSFLIFAIIAYRMGYDWRHIFTSAWNGGKSSFVVLRVFVLIGLVTASWLIAGTIPAIVYYSMQVMNPRYFVVFTFLTTSMVSYMLGTSLGTSSTIGIVLIIMARGGDINLNLVGGAILAGCYFGDRCSPMSSSANLISNLTNTELYPMLKKFRRTTLVPFLISVLIYFLLSLNNPLEIHENTILRDIENFYVISLVVLLPALTMLVLSIFQVNVRKSMAVSIILGSLVAMFIQGAQFKDLLHTLILGYRLDPINPLSKILKGGGFISMLKPGLVVFISCSMAGVLQEIGVFEKTQGLFRKVKTRSKLFLATAGASFVSAAFGGNQSIAVVMVSRAMSKVYDRLRVDNYELATDISNTAILMAATIPWNIANFVIATTLELSPVLIVPYAVYLYIPFIYNYIALKKSERNS